MNNLINTSNSDDVFELLSSLPHPVREELFVELALKGYFNIDDLLLIPWHNDCRSAQRPLANLDQSSE